jgi:hypothetical protein
VEIAELWRYPVKSLRGELLDQAELLPDGIAGDRLVQVVHHGRIVTSRVRPKLLGLRATLDGERTPLVDGLRWDDPRVLAAVREATALPTPSCGSTTTSSASTSSRSRCSPTARSRRSATTAAGCGRTSSSRASTG